MKTDRHSAVPSIPGPRPRVLIVEARFYDEIADHLLSGARSALEVAGAEIDIVTVPGALEIPGVVAMAQRAAAENPDFQPFDGYVVLGCVIRGETTHYEVVAGESNRALMDMVAREGIALGNGILTVENEAQALMRARPGELDKGGGAAQACLAMIAVQRRFGIAPAGVDAEDREPDIDAMLNEIIEKAGGRRQKR
jgi:6,7-dimethyl-8-ribityllumazine synthase